MKAIPQFQRLIRFIDVDGVERYGDISLDENITEIESGKVSAVILEGDVQNGFKRTDTQKLVQKVCLEAYCPN